MNIDELNELDWLAFQYIADELDESKRAAFEEQLAEDQRAREAVARSVELTQAMSTAARVHQCRASIEQKVDLWRHVGWTAGAIAGCLAFVLAYQLIRGRIVEPPSIANGNGVAESSVSTSEQLAFAWIETMNELTQPESHDLVVPLDSEYDTFGLVETNVDDEDDGPAPPDWMFAALSGLATDVDMSESSDMDMEIREVTKTMEN